MAAVDAWQEVREAQLVVPKLRRALVQGHNTDSDCFILSWSFLGSILSSQTDPPTFKNDGFMQAGDRFLKDLHFRSKDGFESVLELKPSSNHHG